MLNPNTLVHDRYLIARRVSGDSAGAVYETIDLLQTRTPIVLKQVLVAEGADATPDLPRREVAEHGAQLLAGLHHPSLPVVRESFAEAQSVFLAMELVPGDDLATLIERNGRPFPADQVLRWAAQLLDALEYLHTQQPPLIHGDITPQNLNLARCALGRQPSATQPRPRHLCRPSRPGAQPPTSAPTCLP
jgi:serine/threonine protein kinase